MNNAGQTLAFSLEALRSRIAGEVVTPEDDNWDAARQASDLAAELADPTAIVHPKSAKDVAEVRDFARSNGLRVRHLRARPSSRAAA